jgi:hypothetical protein
LGGLSYKDPARDEAGRAERAAYDAFDEATADFAESPPTSLAGVVALLDYVLAFNRGDVELNEDSYSEGELWPDGFLEERLPELLRAALASLRGRQ